MIKKAEVKMHGKLAGLLTQNENGYTFEYDAAYLQNEAPPVSLTLPITSQPYVSNIIFPFFDGLIPEGWLLDIVQKNWKLNPRDRMGLLLACCKDCIGAVSIHPVDLPS